jgi:hypothetical protein
MTIANRLSAMEARRGAPRVMILRQDLDDAGIYYDSDGNALTESQIAVMGQDDDLLIIRIEYTATWPPES